MAIFYVLPPRSVFGESLARLLRSYVPGVAIDARACAEMVSTLVAETRHDEEAFVVHREDLPNDDDVHASLRDGFGAEPGDRVVLVGLGPKSDEPQVRFSSLASGAVL